MPLHEKRIYLRAISEMLDYVGKLLLLNDEMSLKKHDWPNEEELSYHKIVKVWDVCITHGYNAEVYLQLVPADCTSAKDAKCYGTLHEAKVILGKARVIEDSEIAGLLYGK